MVKYIGRFFWFGVSISDCVVNCLIGCIFPYLSIISFDWTKVQPYKMFRADGSGLFVLWLHVILYMTGLKSCPTRCFELMALGMIGV